ncbi:lipopolysaccharide biosynthesis protein [Schaalia sp. lx-260]|uniref:lipopolysaccharide biosynthesis protein n=1 Tax=Schaalia sp. lx-260 TaxID=2899082 RepID=UPI001E283185|nr:lipopolysaccharide biosynthesis protein [Schaalia sp. lx-260]MCD4550325.1 lipopolysaccharide biosynthesis protein [Schaalia sp. lx-260]
MSSSPHEETPENFDSNALQEKKIVKVSTNPEQEKNSSSSGHAQQMKKNYLWNTLGSMMNAAASVLMLMAVTRAMGAYAGGIFSLAFAIAQQLQVLGHFEIRPYQATDMRERFSFGVYLSTRIVTCLLMIAGVIAYATYSNGKSFEALLLIFIASLRLFDSCEDVFHGMFQQRGRLDIAGKAFFFRGLATTVSFACAVMVTGDMLLACMLSFVASSVVMIALNILPARSFVSLKPHFQWKSMTQLLITCAPLFAGSFLLAYLSNAPRYGIEEFMTKQFQTYYSIVFMPSLVINLLSGFVFKPLLTDLADRWSQGHKSAFLRIITKGFAVVALASALTMAVAWPYGPELLSLIYSVDISSYRLELAVLIFGGLLNALGVILYYAIVTIRMQRFIVVGYGCAALFALLATPSFIQRWGIMGACILYDSSMAVLAFVFLIATLWGLRRHAAHTHTPPADTHN